MNDFSAIFSSRARFKILESLCPLKKGLKLREIESSTGLGIRSIQIATKALVQEGILLKNKESFFYLNDRSRTSFVLRGLFEYLRNEECQESAKKLSNRARKTINLCDDVGQLIRSRKTA